MRRDTSTPKFHDRQLLLHHHNSGSGRTILLTMAVICVSAQLFASFINVNTLLATVGSRGFDCDDNTNCQATTSTTTATAREGTGRQMMQLTSQIEKHNQRQSLWQEEENVMTSTATSSTIAHPQRDNSHASISTTSSRDMKKKEPQSSWNPQDPPTVVNSKEQDQLHADKDNTKATLVDAQEQSITTDIQTNIEAPNDNDSRNAKQQQTASFQVESIYDNSDYNNGQSYLDPSTTAIRRWGCARNETPFIFVHIGKAGGGGVRSRMAAAALDYNRSGWHRTHEDSTYYYPIYDAQHNRFHKAKFLSSKFSNWIPESIPHFHTDFVYEGHGPCGATTPLGQAIACPVETTEYCQDHDNNDGMSDDRCDLVYMGHNLLGSELHWLPTSYLVKWWKSTPWARQLAAATAADNNNNNGDFIAQAIAARHAPTAREKEEEWNVHDKIRDIVVNQHGGQIPTVACTEGPYGYRIFRRQYQKCFQPKEKVIDQVARHIVTEGTKSGDHNKNNNNQYQNDPMIQWGQMMASMPIIRVTVLREPFSWLTSKFFWHPHFYSTNSTSTPPRLVGPDMGISKNMRRRQQDAASKKATPPLIKCDDMEEAVHGWVSMRAMTYIFYLCGEHCMGGWADGSMTLDDIERQAAYNLRNSFAVVGLLHKTDEFYQMVTQRVFYMDTSLNPEVTGKTHGTGEFAEAARCKELFKKPEFQAELLERSPALAALVRLYKLAVEVNEFQAKELAECSFSSTTETGFG